MHMVKISMKYPNLTENKFFFFHLTQLIKYFLCNLFPIVKNCIQTDCFIHIHNFVRRQYGVANEVLEYAP